MDMLEKELDKIHDFQKAKVSLYIDSLFIRTVVVPDKTSFLHFSYTRALFSVCSLSFVVDTKYPRQTSELSRRIREAEKDVKRLVAEDNTEESSPRLESSADTENQQVEDYTHDGGSDDDLSDDEDESYDELEDRFHGLEEEVANLVADVHDLALYTKLNITGFMKILKVIACSILILNLH